MKSDYFVYDPHAGTVQARNWWGLRRRYPRRGFERLVAYAELYEVSAEGKRHRLWIKAKWAEPRNWEVFVELFARNRAPVAGCADVRHDAEGGSR